MPMLAATYTYGNLDHRMSLDVRFLGEFLAQLIENPESLVEPAPVNWQRQSNVLYLINMLQYEKARKTALAMELDEPDKAWVQFTLYRAMQVDKQGDEALNCLTKSVQLDPAYALEYLNLAERAYDKGRPDEALRMLGLARAVFPDDSQLLLKIAQLANDMGDVKSAKHLIASLKKLTWSPIYYPGMPDYLERFADSLEAVQ